MITKVHIENFKSLANFDFPPGEHRLSPFTCLIGLNGSGKSTLLQAFDFLGQLAVGNMGEWLKRREWKSAELMCKLPETYSGVRLRSRLVKFRVHFDFKGEEVIWEGRYNINLSQCTFEQLQRGEQILLKLSDGRLEVGNSIGELQVVFEKAPFLFQGSILSFLQLKDIHPRISEVKECLKGLKSLELLSPHEMRRKARPSDDIGIGGEKLAPFLAQLPVIDRIRLNSKLRDFYPNLDGMLVKSYRFGWKGLESREVFNRGPNSRIVQTNAAHINDGMLRVIAILAQAYSKHSFLLFDEIENGINPELIEKLVQFLIELGNQGKQVIVTTHSPMILNYIPDDVAKESVIFLYKTEEGKTLCQRFFNLPEMERKLRAMGPGEIFVDTNLTELSERLAEDHKNAESH